MKKLKLFLLLVIALTFVSTPAFAVSISWDGDYVFSDTNNNGIADTLSLSIGVISVVYPDSDPIFSDPTREDARFNTAFTLDEDDLYNFDPSFYNNALTILDRGTPSNDRLFSADADLAGMSIYDIPNNSIDLSFISMILSDFTAGPDYVGGSSLVVDEFLSAVNGDLLATLQFAGNLDYLLQNLDEGGTLSGTYSATAAVPEPATMLLLGFGLIGLAGASRKKLLKK